MIDRDTYAERAPRRAGARRGARLRRRRSSGLLHRGSAAAALRRARRRRGPPRGTDDRDDPGSRPPGGRREGGPEGTRRPRSAPGLPRAAAAAGDFGDSRRAGAPRREEPAPPARRRDGERIRGAGRRDGAAETAEPRCGGGADGTPGALAPDVLYEGVVTARRRGRPRSPAWASRPTSTGSSLLEDVSWARAPDPESAPRRVRSIDKVFREGDVALFRLRPASEDEQPEIPEDAVARGPLPGTHRPGGALLRRRRERRGAGAGRWLRLRGESVQSRHPGATPAGLRLQAADLLGGAREGLHPGLHPVRPARRLHRRGIRLRLAAAELQGELLRPDHDARGARAIGEQRHGPPLPGRRRRLRDRLRAPARHRIAAEPRSLAGPRLERSLVVRTHAGVRGLRRAADAAARRSSSAGSPIETARCCSRTPRWAASPPRTSKRRTSRRPKPRTSSDVDVAAPVRTVGEEEDPDQIISPELAYLTTSAAAGGRRGSQRHGLAVEGVEAPGGRQDRDDQRSGGRVVPGLLARHRHGRVGGPRREPLSGLGRDRFARRGTDLGRLHGGRSARSGRCATSPCRIPSCSRASIARRGCSPAPTARDIVFEAFLPGTEPTERAETARTTAEGRRLLRLDDF